MWKLRKISGFTLIEMAVVLLVTGLIIASTASYYGLYLKREAEKTTGVHMKAVTDQISAFRNINGRYPAPASLTLPRGNPDYGREDATVCRNVAKAPGTCENGICIKSTSRDLDPAIPGNETVRVCVGTIPFRQLNLGEEYAFDAYNSRLLYAVTENMTNDTLFKADIGGIEILKAQGTDSALADADRGSAHFVIISPGPNRAGAYTADGVQLPCPSTGAENTNCNNGPAATFRIAQTDTSSDNTAFDDKINYFIREPVPLWQMSPDAAARTQGDMILKPSGALGTKINSVNNDDPLLSKAFVNGVMRASKSMEGQKICNEGGNDCFYASALAGPLLAPNDNSGMKCPEDDPDGAGQYMVAITAGKPVCEDVISAVCPEGQVMVGKNASGIQCVTAAGPPPCINCCPSFTTSICNRPYTVPERGASGVVDVYDTNGTGGAWEYWYCNPQSQWVLAGTNYSCDDCVPVAEEFRNFGCGQGFTGDTAIYRIALSCPGYAINFLDAVGGWQGPPVSSNCQCIEETQTIGFDCPGQTGIYNASRNHVCDNYDPATNSGDYWTDWDHSAASSCPCTPGPVQQQQACPSGSGYILIEGTRSCPDGNVTGWQEVANYCSQPPTCDPSEYQEYYDSCPQGYTPNPNGTLMRQTRNCTTGGWNNPQFIFSDCIPGQPSSCAWAVSGTPQTSSAGGIGARAGTSCSNCSASGPCYTGNGPWSNYSNCTCSGG